MAFCVDSCLHTSRRCMASLGRIHGIARINGGQPQPGSSIGYCLSIVNNNLASTDIHRPEIIGVSWATKSTLALSLKSNVHVLTLFVLSNTQRFQIAFLYSRVESSAIPRKKNQNNSILVDSSRPRVHLEFVYAESWIMASKLGWFSLGSIVGAGGFYLFQYYLGTRSKKINDHLDGTDPITLRNLKLIEILSQSVVSRRPTSTVYVTRYSCNLVIWGQYVPFNELLARR